MTAKPTHTDLMQKIRELDKEAKKRQKAEEQVKKQSEFLNLVLESLSHPF